MNTGAEEHTLIKKTKKNVPVFYSSLHCYQTVPKTVDLYCSMTWFLRMLAQLHCGQERNSLAWCCPASVQHLQGRTLSGVGCVENVVHICNNNMEFMPAWLARIDNPKANDFDYILQPLILIILALDQKSVGKEVMWRSLPGSRMMQENSNLLFIIHQLEWKTWKNNGKSFSKTLRI